MMVLAMKAAQAFAPIPQEWNDAPNDAAAILVEFRSDDPDELAALRGARRCGSSRAAPVVQPARFTRDPELTEVYWRVREGLHGLLGKIRPRGTSLIIEDVCVPPARIAEAAAEIRALLGQHGFLPGRRRATRRRATCTSCSRPRSASRPTATATRRSWATWSR